MFDLADRDPQPAADQSVVADQHADPGGQHDRLEGEHLADEVEHVHEDQRGARRTGDQAPERAARGEPEQPREQRRQGHRLDVGVLQVDPDLGNEQVTKSGPGLVSPVARQISTPIGTYISQVNRFCGKAATASRPQKRRRGESVGRQG
jgi:hypothetical protein